MNIFSCILRLACLLVALSCGLGAQTDKRIEAIRQTYQQVNQQIAECEANGEYSTTFLSELVVNKNNGPYPAVGIYQSVIKFYYTFGDREKNPYPDRLLKITVTTKRSDRTEAAEFLFNPAGQLIFYYEKKESGELRDYLAGERPLKIAHGEATAEVSKLGEAALTRAILKEKQKLAGIFRHSLN